MSTQLHTRPAPARRTHIARYQAVSETIFSIVLVKYGQPKLASPQWRHTAWRHHIHLSRYLQLPSGTETVFSQLHRNPARWLLHDIERQRHRYISPSPRTRFGSRSTPSPPLATWCCRVRCATLLQARCQYPGEGRKCCRCRCHCGPMCWRHKYV